MKQYLDIVKDVIANGHIKSPVRKNHQTGKWEPVDGGVKTLALPNVFFTHNMCDGFPLLTTKKMAWKAIRVELEGFIKGITDKRWYKERGCKIWNEFGVTTGSMAEADWEARKLYQLNSNDLGPIYGKSWRDFGGTYTAIPSPNIPYTKIGQSIDGKVYDHHKYGQYILVDQDKDKVEVQFLNTGYKYWCQKRCVKDNKIKDPYHVIHFGAGCVGPRVKCDVSPKRRNKLYNLWVGIVARCYNELHPGYKNYGARGVRVSNDWLIFSNFLTDIQHIDGWHKKLAKWNHYGLHTNGPVYDKTTCAWKPGIQKYSEIGGIVVGFDQLKNIVDTLHNNPSDRRMVCSAWNPLVLDRVSLPPCHWGWNVTVIGGKLNLCWIQRSCDLMLGVPFNIASYALLLTLLAKEANLEPGNLSGVLVDCHIYENQLDGVKEQLLREPRGLPSIYIKDSGNFSIFDWTYEDVELLNYNPHPAIRFGEVVV